MEFIKGSTNLDTRLEIPVRSYLPGDDSEGNIMMKVNDGVYKYGPSYSRIVSGGNSFGLRYSDDGGRTWTASNYSDGDFNAPCYGNGIWVAGRRGTQGIWRSTDNGVTWSQSGAPSNVNYNAIVFYKGKFVAASTSGLYYSTDGQTWSTVYSSGLFYTFSIAGNYIFTHNDNYTYRSSDGATWEQITNSGTPNNDVFRNIAYFKGKYVATNVLGIYNSSTSNLGSWTKVYENESRFLAFKGDEIILASSTASKGIYYSYDGTNWKSNITSNSCYELAYGNGVWVCGSYNSGIRYSKDGITWYSSSITTSSYYQILFNGGCFVAFDYSGNSGIHYSYDGITWYNSNITNKRNAYNVGMSAKSPMLVSSFANSGLWYSEDNGSNWQQSNITSNNWLVSYYNGIWHAQGTKNSSAIKYSYDGKTWTNNPTLRYGNTGCSIVYGKGKWISSLWSYGVAYSTDGLNWTQCSGDIPSNGSMQSITFANDVFIACGNNTNTGVGIYRSEDGITWTRVYSSRGVFRAYYGEGVWIAALEGASSGKTLLRSTDNGLTWSEITNSPDSTTSRYFRNMLYTDGVWIAAINSGYSGIYISTDNGATFRQTYASGNYDFVVKQGDVIIAGGRANVSGTNMDVIIYSKNNGESWSISDWLVETRRPRACVWAGDRFVVTTESYGAWYSFDGIHWTQSAKTTGSGHTSMYSMVYQSGDWEKLVNFIGDHKGFIGEVKPSIGPQNDSWLLCDGSTYDTSKYSGLYAILGTNKLPDFREVIPVAIGENTNLTFPTGHDVFTLGQIKERSVTNHGHTLTASSHTHTITLPQTAHSHTYNTANTAGVGTNYEMPNYREWPESKASGNTNTSRWGICDESDVPIWASGEPTLQSNGSGVFRVKSYGVNYYIRAKY